MYLQKNDFGWVRVIGGKLVFLRCKKDRSKVHMAVMAVMASIQ
jgi:hypothetical protein